MKALAGLLTTVLLVASGSASAGELRSLLEDALQHPGVAARTTEVAAANLQLNAATARYLGSGAVLADNATYESSRFLGVLNPAGFANLSFARSQLRYGANYTLPVDLFGVIAANRDAAKQNLAMAQLVLRQDTLIKLHQALAAYLNLQALQTQSAALALQQRRVAATLERVTAQVEVGSLGTTDLKLAQSEMAHVQAEQAGLDGERGQALAQLEEATGHRQMPTVSESRIPRWQEPDAVSTLPVRIATSEASEAASKAKAARRALLPSISAGADYYQFDGGGHSQETWSIGARISMPLDFGAFRATAGADAHARAALEAKDAVQRKARSDAAALRAAYDAANADVAAVNTEISYREQVVVVQDELTKVGAQSVEDSLRHIRDRAAAESRLAQARAQAIQAWSAAQVLAGTEPEAYIKQLDEQ